MNQPSICISAPVSSHRGEIWFSAYGFGWGYRAFAISYDDACESLGASDVTEEQIRLAFQSGEQTLLRAIRHNVSRPAEGKRIRLSLDEACHSIPSDSLEPGESAVSRTLVDHQ